MKHIYRYILTVLCVLAAHFAEAQSVTISGPVCVAQASTATYTVTGITNPYQTGYAYGGSNAGGTANTIKITWGTVGTDVIYIPNPSNGTVATFNVTVVAYGSVQPGTISAAATEIAYGTSPGYINSQTLASTTGGGGCTAVTFTYQWQQSTDGTNFTDIPGATDATKYYPDLIFRTTYFRRTATSAATGPLYTFAVKIYPTQNLDGGTVNPVSSYFSTPSTTVALTSIDAARGGCSTGSYVYQWQESTDNINFTDIVNAGTANLNYSTDASKYYRRMVTCGGNTAYSNVVGVIKTPLLNDNYVRTYTTISPNGDVNNTDPVGTYGVGVQQQTQYAEGLGRTIQNVSRKGSLVTGQAASDMVTPVIYDARGRQADNYLPYADVDIDGSLKATPTAKQKTFYTTQLAGEPGETVGAPADAPWAYSHLTYETSPQSRTKETFEPGLNFAGTASSTDATARHSVKTAYLNNISNDNLRIWTVASVTNDFGTYQTSTSYLAGQLSKVVTTDEAGYQTVTFKDKDGNLILRRVQLTNAESSTSNAIDGWICTLYIYDNFNRLRCIVQPEGVKALNGNGYVMNQTILDEQCFRYEYDARGSVIRKKVPGGAITETVYDQRNRPVMSQDPNLKAAGKWNVVLYDGLNRAIQTGLWADSRTQAQHTVAAVGISNYPFATSATPSSGYERLTQTGYDDYSLLPTGAGLDKTFDGTGSDNFFAASQSNYPWAETPAANGTTDGKVTWQETKILGSSPAKYLYNLNLYDYAGRLIQVKSTNITGGIDAATTQYNWHNLPLIQILKQQQAIAPVVTTIVVTRTSYDDLERAIKIEKRLQNTLVNSNVMSTYFTTQETTYDALGHLKINKIGQSKDVNGIYSGTALETLTADYGVSGKLLGINRKYLSGVSSNYFGFELGYEKIASNSGRNFLQASYNGNISGVAWKSKGSGVLRKYDYKYDKSDRLLSAAFEQYNPDATWGNGRVKFDELLGDGIDQSNAYDLNGNINQLQNWGLKSGVPAQIDNMTYSYNATSNRLRGVTEVSGTVDNKLGDFTDKNTTADDYGYDPNGNLVTDLNKRINGTTGSNITSGGGITYNQFNLPVQITIKDDAGNARGSISYTYDAAGMKLSRTVVDQSVSGKTLTTADIYINGAIYESFTNSLDATANYTNRLISLPHEQGRIRFKPALGSTVARFDIDYFIKDHLGNIRMVLSDENQTDIYQATMEPSQASFETALFGSKINTTLIAKPTGFDTDANNTKVSVVNASTDNGRIGPGIILKVMAGDMINAKTYAWYQPTGMDNTTNTTLPAMVTSLLTQLTPGVTGLGKGTSAEGVTSTNLQPGLQSLLNNQTPATSAPKAFLNFVLLDDERFEYVTGSVVPVPQITGTQTKQLLQLNGGNDISIPRNGYLYVYVSNESKGNVYFDDIRIDHKRGPLLEETHYYPFGLTMAGISSKANKGITYQENPMKYNGIELNANLDINEYETQLRNLDPQTGRWWQIDPRSDDMTNNMDSWSPYVSNKNNPILNKDPKGDCPNCLVGAIVGFAVDAVVQVSASVVKSTINGTPITLESIAKDYNFTQAAAAAAAGAITSGLSAVEEAGTSLATKTFKVVAVNTTFSYIKQSFSEQGVRTFDLIMDAIPLPEGEAKILFNTKTAEKTLARAENALAATTAAVVPARKIAAVATAKKTLNTLNNVNSIYNQFMQGLGSGITTSTITQVRDLGEADDKKK